MDKVQFNTSAVHVLCANDIKLLNCIELKHDHHHHLGLLGIPVKSVKFVVLVDQRIGVVTGNGYGYTYKVETICTVDIMEYKYVPV